MKKIINLICIAFAAIVLTSCHEREYDVLLQERASSACFFYDGFVVGSDLHKYTLELDGVMSSTGEEFCVELVVYNDFHSFLPDDYYSGSRYYGPGRMLYGGGDGQGSFIGFRKPGNKDYEWYAIDGGSVDVDYSVGRDGGYYYDVFARLFVTNYKYEISYAGSIPAAN